MGDVVGDIFGSVIGGVAANEAADSAADGQRYAADRAAETARLGFDFARNNPYIRPYVNTGLNAQNMMAALLGVPTGAPAGMPDFGAMPGEVDMDSYFAAVPEARAFVDRVMNDPQGKIWSPDKGWQTEAHVRMRDGGFGSHTDPAALARYWYQHIGSRGGAPNPGTWDPSRPDAWRTPPIMPAQAGKTSPAMTNPGQIATAPGMREGRDVNYLATMGGV